AGDRPLKPPTAESPRRVPLLWCGLRDVHATVGHPVELGRERFQFLLGRTAQVLAPEPGKLLLQDGHFAGFRGVHVDIVHYWFTRALNADEIVPAICLRMHVPARAVDVRASKQCDLLGNGDTLLSLTFLDRPKSSYRSNPFGIENRLVEPTLCFAFALSPPAHADTASPTASAISPEKPLKPPHPDTRGSGAPGSSEEMSFATTPPWSRPKKYVRYLLSSAQSNTSFTGAVRRSSLKIRFIA